MQKNQNNFLSDKDYDFIFSRVPRLCLDFVIIKNGEVLLGKRDIEPSKGDWTLPGGMLRYKESVKDASMRILTTEVGLKPVSVKMVGFLEFPKEINKDGVEVHSVSIVFLTTLEEGEPVGSDQAREVKYFEKIPANAHPLHSKFIKDNWELLKK